MQKSFISSVLIFFCSFSSQVFAENNKLKNIVSVNLYNDFYNDRTYESDNRKNEFNNSELRTNLVAKIKLTDHFYVRSVVKFQEMQQASETVRRNQLATGSGAQSYENGGAFLEQLNLNYTTDKYLLSAGKINADFGQAWLNSNNSIWLRNLSRNNYRQSEKLGFLGSLKAGNKKTIGEYVFTLSSFTNDRKYLDNSIITKRDVDSKDAGRPGDNGGLSSYNASMNINYDFGNEEKLSYHFAYFNLAVNERQSRVIPAKIDDEKGYSANMNYKYPVNEKLAVDGLIEYAELANLNGNIDNSANFLTTNLVLWMNKNWSTTIGQTSKHEFNIGSNGIDTKTTEISFGYKFDESSFLKGLQIMIGQKEDSIDSKTNIIKSKVFGSLLRYNLEF